MSLFVILFFLSFFFISFLKRVQRNRHQISFLVCINIRMYNETTHVNVFQVTTNNREWSTNETKGNVSKRREKTREENDHWTDEGQLLAQIISYRFISRDIVIDMYRREKINCVLINCTYFHSLILSDLDVPVDF